MTSPLPISGARAVRLLGDHLARGLEVRVIFEVGDWDWLIGAGAVVYRAIASPVAALVAGE